MLLALTDLQRLAYQLSGKRSSRNILHFHLQALVFAANFTTIFQNLKSVNDRAMYGALYHCITVR